MENTFGKEKAIIYSYVLLKQTADAAYIEQKLKPQGMEFTEYMRLVRSALTKQDVQQKKYVYTITQLEESPNDLEVCADFHLSSDHGVQLIWKMRIADEADDEEAPSIFVCLFWCV